MSDIPYAMAKTYKSKLARPYKKKKAYGGKAKGATDNTVTVWSDHSVLEKANKALYLANQMKRFINVETKAFDVTQSAVPVPSTGNIIGLSGISLGDQYNQRDGSSIKLLNLTVRSELASVSTATTGTIIRLIVFRGKQENGSGFAATDILETATVYSPKAFLDRFRTKVLMDETFVLNNPSTGQGGKAFFEKVIKLEGHTSFQATGSSIEDGGVYCLQLSNQPVNTPAINAIWRLTFTDN